MRGVGRIRAFGAALLSLVGGKPRTNADAVAADAAPRAWVAYADRVAWRLQSTLDGADEAACRLRAWLEQQAMNAANATNATNVTNATNATNPPPDAQNEAPVLRLKTWLDSAGRIERVECLPRCAPQIEADFDSVTLGRWVGAEPPRGMMQPVVVRLGALMGTDRAVESWWTMAAAAQGARPVSGACR